MTEGQLQKQTRVQETAVKIKEYIHDHGMKTGDKLPNEFQLMEICEVGRSTVRDAIKILVYEKHVEIVRGCGTFVAEKEKNKESENIIDLFNVEINYKTAMEFFEVRMMLEPEIASLAAINATADDCKKLMKLCENVEYCILNDLSHMEADVEFHRQIAVCSKNEMAVKLMNIVSQGVRYFIAATGNRTAPKTLIYHRAIAKAILSGDSIGAKCNMITHLNEPRNRILKELEEKDKKYSE